VSLSVIVTVVGAFPALHPIEDDAENVLFSEQADALFDGLAWSFSSPDYQEGGISVTL
jgi:hypothetical protein